MKKIAIVFPGVGYTKDRPLLYYAGKLAVNGGYELKSISFSGLDWSKEKLKDPGFLQQTLDKCLRMTEEALTDAGNLNDADVVFISKSIGTVVATAYAKKKGIKAKQICFSPLELIDGYVAEEGAVLFCADADPYADYATLERIAREKKLEMHRIEGGNHSLETGDIPADIDNLHKMMRLVAGIIGK
jgi:phosphoglycolate phosphatase